MGWDAEWYGSPAESFTVSRDTGLAELRLSPGGRWPEVSWEIKESDGSIRHSAVLIAAGETGMNESVVGNEFFRNGEWLVRVGVRGPEPAELTARCAVILAIPSGSFRFTAGTGGWIDIDGLRESLKEDLELSFSYTTGSVEDQR